jgi:hypothetical protein
LQNDKIGMSLAWRLSPERCSPVMELTQRVAGIHRQAIAIEHEIANRFGGTVLQRLFALPGESQYGTGQ